MRAWHDQPWEVPAGGGGGVGGGEGVPGVLSEQRDMAFSAPVAASAKPPASERRQGHCAYILSLGPSTMFDPYRPIPSKPAAVTPRLITGGLSLLLVLAFALAAGVPAGHLLATVGSGGAGHGGFDRAVAPQIIERQARRAQQERPDPTRASASFRSRTALATRRFDRAAASTGQVLLVREALLALPPPANSVAS